MTPEDERRVAAGNSHHRSLGLSCAICDEAPTCPMLDDDLWRQVWHLTTTVHTTRTTRCTCVIRATRPRSTDDSHSLICEKIRGPRQLLCLECVEMVLGRMIRREDLRPCVGNLTILLMVARLR